MSASEQESQGPVIKDRRRIDPVTGQPRQPAQSAEPPAGGSGGSSPQADTAGGSGGSSPRTSAEAGDGSAGQPPRGPGQPRPGKHAVSKPGSLRQEAAGAAGRAGSAGSAGSAGQASATTPASGGQDVTDQATSPAGADEANQQSGGPEVAAMLAERTADLQRVQAEYANYRKRVERDRVAVREHALASVVAELLPVLDDIGRAREHEELTGGFKAVAERLESAVSKLGLTTFGEAGEAFDPNVHEALMHSYSPDVTEPTCVQILQPGYKVGERILRPARVAVAEPTDPAGARTVADADADLDFSQSDATGMAESSEPAQEPDDAH